MKIQLLETAMLKGRLLIWADETRSLCTSSQPGRTQADRLHVGPINEGPLEHFANRQDAPWDMAEDQCARAGGPAVSFVSDEQLH